MPLAEFNPGIGAMMLADDDFTFQHLETDEDIEQNFELMRQVFGQTDGVDTLVKKLITHHPIMTLKDFFVIKHHGKIIASLNLIPVRWSIGGVPLKVAEMGCVATLTGYRHRGLQRRLIKEFHMQATKREYDLCAIEGIPYFYRQFGYEYAIPLNEETRIRLDQIPDYESKLDIRPFTEKDISKAMQLLMQSQRKFYIHAARDEQIWKMQQQTSLASGSKFDSFAVEKDGDMLGYLRISDKPETKELILRETADTDYYTGKAILKFLKDTGKQHGFETLIANTSYREPLSEQLVALGAIQRIPPYAWQIRIIDYVKIFEKMKTLFEKRLATSPYCHLTEKLNFNFRRYTVEVSVEDGVIPNIQKSESNEDRTIGLNPLVFTQLLLGHRSRNELEMIYPDFGIRQSHKHLIDVLFPKLLSYIHSAY
jgi:predicted N-acetyltransferase YhbS